MRINHSRFVAPLFAGALLLLPLIGCGGGESSVPAERGPAPVVTIDLTQTEPAVEQTLSQLVSDARAEPDSATARAALGMAYELNGFPQAATRCYEQAFVIDPAQPRWGYFLALMRADAGDLDGALRAAAPAVQRRPVYPSAHLHSANWLLDLWRSDEALELFDGLLSLDPTNRFATAGKARALLALERPEQVVRLVEEYAAGQPTDAELVRLAGEAYRDMGQLEQADAQMTRVGSSQHAGEWPDPWNEDKQRYNVAYGSRILRAEELMVGGQVDRAVAEFEALLELRPDDPQLINTLSVAYRRQQQTARAEDLLRRGLEAHPDYAPLQISLGLLEQERGEFAAALARFDRAVEISPSLAYAHARRGFALMRLERLDQALEAFRRALELEPTDPTHWLYAGAITTQRGDCRSAIGFLDEAVRLAPGLGPAYPRIVECSARLGEFEHAEWALGRVADLAPENPQIPRMRQFIEDQRAER
jgi:tetratricopeptide (TPR) repeat protein